MACRALLMDSRAFFDRVQGSIDGILALWMAFLTESTLCWMKCKALLMACQTRVCL